MALGRASPFPENPCDSKSQNIRFFEQRFNVPPAWDRQWLDHFEAQIDFPLQAIEGLTPTQWNERPIAGSWTIRELVVHVVDADLVGGWRMKRVIAEPNPAYWAFDQDAFQHRLAPSHRDLPRLAQLFRLHRLDLLDVLRQLPDEDFQRTGLHSEAGLQSLAQLVQTYVRHIENHRQHLNRKRQALGAAQTQEILL